MNIDRAIFLLEGISKIISHGKTSSMRDTHAALADLGLDSFDRMLIGFYLCEWYGISNEVSKTFAPITLQDVIDFLKEHATKEPEKSDEELMGEVQ